MNRVNAGVFSKTALIWKSRVWLSQWRSESAGYLAAFVLLCLCAGCTSETAPPGVSCDKLRQLHVGATEGDVRRIVGSPVTESRQDGSMVFAPGPKESDALWTWRLPTSGVRIVMYFSKWSSQDSVES
jgi:hypothetical protein